MANALTNANIIAFIVSDPLHVGFAAIRAANPGADAPLLAAANNASGPGAGTKPGPAMAANAVFSLLDAGEWITLTEPEEGSWNQMVAAQPMLMGDPGWQAKFNALFANYPKSLAAIQAFYTQPASPWEVYFGAGQVATTAELDAARNSGAGSNF